MVFSTTLFAVCLGYVVCFALLIGVGGIWFYLFVCCTDLVGGRLVLGLFLVWVFVLVVCGCFASLCVF